MVYEARIVCDWRPTRTLLVSPDTAADYAYVLGKIWLETD